MKFKTLAGKVVSKNCSKCFIKWDGKSRSKLQFKVKQLLKPIWFGQAVYEEFPVAGSRMKVDFLNLTIHVAIEVQGPQHEEVSPFFHKNSLYRFQDSLQRDNDKAEWLELNGFKLIEIIEEDLKDLKQFYERIL